MSVTGVLAAAIDGTVVNGTTGKPQPGASVTVFRIAQNGMDSIGTATADAQGKFSISKDADGPRLLQAAYAGVTYNLMLQPGAATSGLTVDVFDASPRQGDVKVSQHFVIFQPAEGQMKITEGYIFRNDGRVTWHDPSGGTLRFFLPPAAKGEARIQATAPQGMPVERSPEKTPQANVYKLDFAVKPGETRFDVNYSVPYAAPADFESRVLYPGVSTSLVVPPGVEIKGDGLALRGQEPNSQASIYEVAAAAYKVQIAGEARAAEAADSGEPNLQEILPRMRENLGYVLGIAFGILILGFVLLYRAQEKSTPAHAAAKGAHMPRHSSKR